MKILIITYYWPPAGGSGVQRWLRFAKYLQDFGITPVIYTIDNPDYALVDNSLKNEVPENVEVLKYPIWEPNNILSFLKSKEKQTSAGFLNPNPSFFEKKLQYIRANYFIPDARKFWIKPSVKFLSKYLKNNEIDVIISTGPPHSLHLIAEQLQKKLKIKWIADFRDPWTDIDYFHQLPLTEKSKIKHKELEHEVLQNADAILVVGKTMKEKFKPFSKNIHVITNGFDDVDFGSILNLDKKFTFTHIGLMNADRNPKLLWKVFADLIKEDAQFEADLQINLIGKVSPEVIQDLKTLGLLNQVKLTDYLPHNEVLQHQNSAQILLLAVNNVPSSKGIITGKIFEYLLARRPILAIAPTDGDLAEIINTTNSGVVVGFSDEENLKKSILKYYQNFKEGSLNIESKNIDQFHRKNLTKQLVEVLNSLSK